MLVETEADYKAMLEGISRLQPRDALAIDTETTGLAMYQDDHVTGISVAYYVGQEVASWYLPVAHAKSEIRNRSARRLLDVVAKHPFHVYHNAIGVDWVGLQKLGLKRLPERFHDTQVQSWLSDENVNHKLKMESARLLGEDSRDEEKALRKLLRGGKTWADLTALDIAAYGDRDAVLTLELMDCQVGRYGSDSPALAREHEIQRVLHAMMDVGIRVDPEKCGAQLAEAEVRHTELAGLFDEINLNSPKQVAEMIYDDWGVECLHRTPAGARSSAKAALEELEWHDGVAELMEYRRLDKAITGYYRPYVERVCSDGRIRPSFSSTRTVTGRFSCSAPNLQTIPREDTLTGVRELFLPDPGFELWEYDLSQAEYRVMAGWAGEIGLIEAIERGDDMHSLTASRVFGTDFTGLQRRLGKNLNYGWPYGIGPGRFATYMVAGTGKPVTRCDGWNGPGFRKCRRCTVCEAAKIIESFERGYPRLNRLKRGLAQQARRLGYLPLHVEGRFRHFRSPGKQVPYYTALNAVVQGGIGEFMKDVMLEVSRLSLPGRMCLQVHDSLVWEVEPGAGHRIGAELQRIADAINPFDMRMVFDAKEWSEHD